MRKLPLLKLPLLLVLLLLSLMLLAAAASAKGASLPLAGNPIVFFSPAPGDEADEPEDESESDEGEGEDCGAEGEELCEEELEGEGGEECVIEDASPSVVVASGSQKVLLTIRYHSLESTLVTIDARLRGGKGGLHLGNERTRFGRTGTFHDSFSLGPKQLGKALAAREFEVDLHAVGTPADCELQLATRGSRRAK